jgi:putative ABC transport system permease protein
METNRINPPRYALRFLEWFCPPGLYESIEGDLFQQFEEDVRVHSQAIAKRKFVLNVIKFFRPEIVLRNRFSFQLIHTMMLRSYFKITYRTILKSKGYSFINVFGLSLGIAVCLLTFNFVRFEKSFDHFHPDVDRIYRLNQTNIWDPAGGVFGSTGPAVAFKLKDDFPEIESILRINTPYGKIIRYQKPDGEVIAFNEENILAADSNFFSFFAFELKEGDPGTALVGKDKVILSEEAALRLFGDEPALGKIIQLGDDRTAVEVTGVTAKQPDNVHFHFDYLLSMYTNRAIKQFEWSWVWTQVVTYIKFRPDANMAAFHDKLKTFADRHAPAALKKIGIDYAEFVKDKNGWKFSIQPVKDIYLYSDTIGNRIGPTGDIKYVYIMSGAAFFILLIAVVNFINLSTARAATRAKEVGVKKALGLLRHSLIAQFQVEHISITVISVLLALVFMEALRMILQPLVGFNIHTQWDLSFLIILVGLPIIIGFLAGLYPSFYLTSFNVSQTLKGKVATGFRASGLRNGLVVLQFTISVVLMVATVVVFQQLRYFQSKNIGFEKDNLLIINYAEKLGGSIESFRNEVSHLSGVSSTSISMDIRTSFEDIYMREGDDKKVSIAQYKIDENFFRTTGITLAEGRSFEENRPSDKNAVIITETTARQFGWSNEQALGKRIIYLGDEVGPQEIIGVASDFHFQSLRQNIAPMMFFNWKSAIWGDNRIVLIRYSNRDPLEITHDIEQKWNRLTDATPFSFSFYNEELKKQYDQEQRLSALFSIITGLSIVIAVIGLVGLVAYSTEVRKKEIGIRKVFGASLSSIFMMINTQYVKLMVISVMIASPFAWWLLSQWLSSFAYHIKLNPIVFALCGLVEILLSIACVSYLSIRAAGLNPANVLKEE